jgi:3-hydroxybutyryl-CoA dehydrogenase
MLLILVKTKSEYSFMHFLCKKFYVKIILLANPEQKEELIIQTQSVQAELLWVHEPASLINAAGADACIDLLFDDTKKRIKELRQLQTGAIIINSVINPLNELTTGFIRINGWNTFLKRSIIEASGHDNTGQAENVFSSLNKKIGWVPDIAGFISPRVVASIINEAYFALEEQVSTKKEIDTAMRLGTNYPYGPFEWSKKIGLKNIFNLLHHLAKEQKRYEPAALLTKEATI